MDKKEKEGTIYEDNFYTQLIRSGVFLSPYHHGFFMFTHAETDLNYIEKSVEHALAVVNDKYYG